MSEQKNDFTLKLLDWHASNSRDLPWKSTTDPYKIWLSEVILQQTRVDQGTPYYLKFIEAFPTVYDLAKAPEDAVMKKWEGLGYYSRARNLHHSAKVIAFELNGKFPEDIKGLLSLKGIGEYTASAIASFAYSQPHAVVDGNVKRVISRFLGIEEAIDQPSVIKKIKSAASAFLYTADPGKYNQAIMDLGAIICTPQNPKCSNCPVSRSCTAYAKGLTDKIPSKSKAVKKRERYFHYHIFRDPEFILLHKRTDDDIWKSLYEFYLEESVDGSVAILGRVPTQLSALVHELIYCNSSGPHKHILTHQNIHVWFHYYDTTFNFPSLEVTIDNFYLVEKKKLSTFAFPRVIQKLIVDKKEYE